MKKHISITGDLGSGKSTVAKKLCEMFNYKYVSTGAIQRELGQQKGLNTLEMNYLAKSNEEIDHLIDSYLKNINKETELNYVLDSRLAWHFVQPSFKIYIAVHPMIAAERVLSDDTRKSESEIRDQLEKSAELLERRRVEDIRFKNKYKVNCSDLQNYDMVIDSSLNTVDEIAELISTNYDFHIQQKELWKFWISPKLLYPTLPFNISNLVNEMNSKMDIKTKREGMYHYILWGHGNVAEAIKNKKPFVKIMPEKVELVENDTFQKYTMHNSYTSDILQSWESALKYKFIEYPKFKKLD